MPEAIRRLCTGWGSDDYFQLLFRLRKILVMWVRAIVQLLASVCFVLGSCCYVIHQAFCLYQTKIFGPYAYSCFSTVDVWGTKSFECFVWRLHEVPDFSCNHTSFFPGCVFQGRSLSTISGDVPVCSVSWITKLKELLNCNVVDLFLICKMS